jgi:hypothetical protein
MPTASVTAHGQFAVDGRVRQHLHLHRLPAHGLHAAEPFAALAVEQHQFVAGLQPPHLGVARRAGRQVQRLARAASGGIEMEAKHDPIVRVAR